MWWKRLDCSALLCSHLSPSSCEWKEICTRMFADTHKLQQIHTISTIGLKRIEEQLAVTSMQEMRIASAPMRPWYSNFPPQYIVLYRFAVNVCAILSQFRRVPLVCFRAWKKNTLILLFHLSVKDLSDLFMEKVVYFIGLFNVHLYTSTHVTSKRSSV